MKLSTAAYLSKTREKIFSVAPIKIYFLMKLLTLHWMYASFCVEDLVRMENITVPTDHGNMRINTEGPLNFTRGHLYIVYEFIENTWFLSPEINLHYALELVPKENKNEENTYRYTRNAENDTAYKPENEEGEYTAKYHNVFIAMFPSLSEESIIESHAPYAFTNFLLENPVEQTNYYILAALLLLSEGIDVGLEWKEENSKLKKLVLKRARGESLFFSIDVENRIASRNSREAEHDAKTVIDFFIQYKNKKSIVESMTMEEFKKVEFLDTPQFLIQAYIFEFLETVEDAERVIKAVYEILNDIVVAEKKKNTTEVSAAAAAFKRLFIPSSSKQITYAEAFKEINKTLNDDNFLQEVDLYMPPDGFSLEKDLNFDNNVQQFLENKNYTMFLKNLLRLFCCLLFNPYTETYSTEKIEDKSSPLKKFFETYKNINDKVTTKACNDWYTIFEKEKGRVNSRPSVIKNAPPHKKYPGLFLKLVKLVSDRDYMNIVERNFNEEPQVGILDLLLIISEVTGIDDIRIKTSKLIDELQKKETNIDDFCTRLKDYLEETFKSLSMHQELEITYFNVKRQVIRGGVKEDIVADIIVYINSFDLEEESQRVLFFPLHSRDPGNTAVLQSCISSNSDAFGVVPIEIKEKNSFIGCLLTHYVDKRVFSIVETIQTANLTSTIKKAMEEKPVNIRRMFLLEQIEYLYQQEEFLVYCICYAKEAKLEFTYNSGIVRLIFNILANLPLNVADKRRYCFKVLVYTGIDKIINERFKLDRDLYIQDIVQTENIAKQNIRIMKYIAETNCQNALLEALKISTSIVKEKRGALTTVLLHQPHIVHEIFDCVFMDGTMNLANEILKNYQEIYPDAEGKTTNIIRFYWFLNACRKNKKRALIRALYDSIDIDKIDKRQNQRKHKSDVYSMVVQGFFTFFPNVYETVEKESVLAHIKRKDEKYRKLSRLLDNLLLRSEELDNSDAEGNSSTGAKKRLRFE